MKQICFYLLLFIFSIKFINAQDERKRANFWHFGQFAALDFTCSPPSAISGSSLASSEGSASISDLDGNLLMYTNGMTVWDRNNNPMPNGTGLMGSISSVQSAIIVPHPGNPDRYFIFTTDALFENQGAAGLRYSEVDMTLNMGFGDVIAATKNVPLVTPTQERLVAVKNATSTGYWVIVLKADGISSAPIPTNEYYAYEVTAAGVNATPVISAVGPNIGWNSYGLKISPLGDKLVNIHPNMQVFNFNNSTGVLTHLWDANPPNFIRFVEFSPDGTKLYGNVTSGAAAGVYQMDLTAPNVTAFEASQTLISPAGTSSGQMQIGPDCKIYCNGTTGSGASTVLHVISSPNLAGTACDFQVGATSIAPGQTNHCLTNFVASFFDAPCTNLNFDLTAQNAGCNSDGEITLTINQGIAPFTFQWSNGETTQNISGLSGGWYSVTVTDFNGCPLTDSILVSQPPTALIETAIVTDPTSCGAADGAIDLTISLVGGSNEDILIEDFETDGEGTRYTLVGAQTQATRFFQRGNALNFTQALTGQNNSYYFGARRTTTLPAILTLNPETITGYSNLELCILLTSVGNANAGDYYNIEYRIDGGGWNGLAAFRPTGAFPNRIAEDTNNDGVGDGIQLSNVFQNFCYSIPATGNQIEIRVVTNTPGTQSQFAFDYIRLTGIPPQTYSVLWSNTETTDDISDLTSGNYSVEITTSSGCVVTDNYILTDPCTLSASFIPSDIDICEGSAITFTDNSNGQNIVSWSWTFNGGTPLSASTQGPHTVTFNTSGTYNIILEIENNLGETDDTTIVVNVHSLPTVTANNDSPFCDGESVELTASGGVSYSWSGPNGYSETGSPVNILGATSADAGIYTVTVIDANGCENTAQTSVIYSCASYASFTTSQTSICEGETITFTDNSGGGTIIAWSWTFDGGTPNSASTQGPHSITFNSSGTYNITLEIEDDLGVTDDTLIVITVNAPPTATANNDSPFCEGQTIELTASGGVSYSWSGPNGYSETGSPVSILGATSVDVGIYTVTVTDANGCESTAQTTVQMGDGPDLIISGTDVLCFGSSDGEASVVASGGTPGYTYSWSPSGGNNATTTPIGTGSYTVTVADANGCISQESVTIGEPSEISLDFSTTPSQCIVNDGTATVVANGGTPGYTYSWSPSGGNNATTTPVGAGSYTVTVTDVNNCQMQGTTTIGTANAPVLSVQSSQNISCFGNTDGSIEVETTGGTAPFNYSWSPSGGTGSTATNLAAGTYTVTVTDNAGCTDELSITITEPSALSVVEDVTHATCGLADGMISLSVAGGNGGYTYNWNPNVSTSNIASDLAVGTYDIVITDALGCSVAMSVDVEVGASFFIEATPDASIIEAGESIGLDVNIDSGITVSSINWTPSDGLSCTNCENPIASPLETTTYVVTVIADNGCISSDTVIIVVHQPCGELFVPTIFSPNEDGLNDLECVMGDCVVSVDFTIFNRWGEVVFHTKDRDNCWDGNFRGKPVQTGVYVYKLKATLVTGEIVSQSDNINVIR